MTSSSEIRNDVAFWTIGISRPLSTWRLSQLLSFQDAASSCLKKRVPATKKKCKVDWDLVLGASFASRMRDDHLLLN